MGAGEVKAESPIQAEAERLRDELAYHEHRAKVLESPLISQSRLRSLVEALKRLEATGSARLDDALTRRAPEAARTAFQSRPLPGTWARAVAIASERGLREHYDTPAAGDAWTRGLVGSAWLVGAELVLHYRDGLLESAVLPDAEGGPEGLDLIANARTLGSIPLWLRPSGSTTESRITRIARQALGPSTLTPVPPAPESLVVRGVVTMRVTDLHAADRRRVDAGLPPYLEPVAAITASLADLDPELTSARPLSFFADDVSWTTEGLETHWQLLGALKAWGFAVGALHFRASSLQEVLEFVRALKAERPSFDYPIEGGLLTVNARAALAGGEPPARVRLEFQTRGHEAHVRRVYHAVGRSGVVFPISILERTGAASETVPVPACHGAWPRVLMEDQAVSVIAGSIAPKIVVTQETRLASPPAVCPACGTALVPAGDRCFLRCPDPSCPGRRRARLIHLAGPRGLALTSFDVPLIDKLLLSGGPDDLLGLLSLDPARVEALIAGRGARFAEEVERIRALPLWRVIYLASLEEVGERVSRLAASMAGSVTGLWALEGLPFRPDLIEPRPWAALLTWLREDAPAILRGLDARGLLVQGEDEVFAAPFAGKRVLVLGLPSSFGPGQLVDALERRGAIIDARPRRDTDFVIRGEGASEELFAMALHYGAPEIDEATLRTFLSRDELR